MFLQMHILSGVYLKGVGIMTESTEEFQDVDDLIFYEEEYRPSER